MYVADGARHRIQKFDASGSFITTWGVQGSGDGEFNTPYDVAIDGSRGILYVADSQNQRIQMFDLDGNFIATFGSGGTGDGQFLDPRGLAVDPDGNLYVSDFAAHRIQVFNHP